MDRRTSYHEDYAWSQEQAAALRRLVETRRTNSTWSTWPRRSRTWAGPSCAAVESFLELMLRDLLKIASAPDARPVRHWREEVVLQRRALEKDLKNSMRQLIELNELWHTAVKRADAALDEHGDALLPDLPQACPFSLDELRAASFDIDSAVARLQKLSSKGDGEKA